MSEENLVERARFTPIDSGSGQPDEDRAVTVHFNPVSLQRTVSNTLENKGEGNNKKQYVSQSTAKLSMDLIFDTTPDGQDVRSHTDKVAAFMKPNDEKIPAIVLFEWGTYKFQGMVESYKETLDFFAAGGVPLRASISISLSAQDKVFEPSATSRVDTQGRLQREPTVVPTQPGAAGGAAEASRAAGDPRAARAIATANAQESMRFSTGGAMSVSASVSLSGPAPFTAGGGAGVGIGVSAGGSASPVGAFAGLRTQAVRAAMPKVDPDRLLQRNAAAGLATDRGAAFRVGGQAVVRSSSSLNAEVGATASLRGGLKFEER